MKRVAYFIFTIFICASAFVAAYTLFGIEPVLAYNDLTQQMGEFKNFVANQNGIAMWVNGGYVGLMKTHDGVIDAPALNYVVIGLLGAAVYGVLNGVWTLFVGFGEE